MINHIISYNVPNMKVFKPRHCLTSSMFPNGIPDCNIIRRFFDAQLRSEHVLRWLPKLGFCELQIFPLSLFSCSLLYTISQF